MIKNVTKILISNGIASLAGVVISFMLPRVLSTVEYALYQQYILYVSYINICHIGIASGMFLNYAGNEYKTIEKEQYKSEISLLLLVLCSFSLLGLFLAYLTQSIVVLFAALTIMPHCLIDSFLALYQAWERFTSYAIIYMLPKVAMMVTIIVLIIYGQISGRTTIIANIVVVSAVSSYLVLEYVIFTKRIKASAIFSIKNLKTVWNGFLITLGNYMNLLFHSIDKQFVLALYSTTSFALYSFAMSMQGIMMVFITALSNPFYPRLARRGIDHRYFGRMKELLFVLGAYSGCAYFLLSYIVTVFLKEYIDSLTAIGIFFAVFPAMGVINVLYINLYRIRRKLKTYLLTLIGMLFVAIILNGISALLQGDYLGITIATVLSYYIWLFYSQRDFAEIKIGLRDTIYLLFFLIVYSLSVFYIKNVFIGFWLYAIIMSFWSYAIYKETIIYFVRHYITRANC